MMAGEGDVPGEEHGGFLLTRLLGTALNHWKLVLGCALLAFAVVASTLFGRRTWVSTSAVVPQASGRLNSGLAGVAAQFGVSLMPSGDESQSPLFYAEMLTSRRLLEQLAETRFQYTRDGETRVEDLYAIYKTHGTPLEKREQVVRYLTRDVEATVSQRTGIVRLSVTAIDPVLAQAMNARLLALLSAFNTTVRQSQAGAERRYAQVQLAQAQTELHAAEDELEAFLQQNASYQSSQRLKLQAARLDRQVTHRQSLYSALAQSYEQARLEEVRDTPQLSIVEAPEVPALPKSRQLLVRAPASLILGGVVGLLLAALIDVLRSLPAADPTGFRQLQSQWMKTLGRTRVRDRDQGAVG